MMTRRDTMKAAAAAGALGMAGIARAEGATLSLQHFPAGEKGFFRAPVLISGPTEAVLIDGGFAYPNGQAVADAITASGKKLTAIYVSQSDPDYYFSLKPIRAAFPDVPVLAASDTLAAINGNVAKKLEVWAPKLGEFGPQTMDDIVLPTAYDEATLSVDDEVIEIIAAEDMTNRRYLWVPALQAVIGGVLVFQGVHVWTADTQTPEIRAAWVANLDAIAARNPAVVVAGHMAPDAAIDPSGVAHTKAYLLAFEEEIGKAVDGAALQAAMEARFPGLGMGVALEIGSKVAKGEMKWG